VKTVREESLDATQSKKYSHGDGGTQCDVIAAISGSNDCVCSAAVFFLSFLLVAGAVFCTTKTLDLCTVMRLHFP
jgi:hypothetical protein